MGSKSAKESENTMYSWGFTNGELFKTLAAHNVSLSATHRNSQCNSLHVIYNFPGATDLQKKLLK